MSAARREVLLDAAIERVWAFVTTPRVLPQWFNGVERVQAVTTAETASGTRFELTRHGQTETWIVADWEPPRRVRYTEYRRNIQLWLELAADGPRTRLRASWEAPGSGLLGRLSSARSGAMLERSLARLHELIKFNRDIRLLHGTGDEAW